MDEIVWTVNPKNDTLDHLATYISHYADSLLKLASIRCRLEVPPTLPVCGLSAQFRHTLFLAVKEGLTNILKHADATEAQLGLVVDQERLVINLTDNGRGFDPQTLPGGRNGLSNMRTRTKNVGGHLQIDSQPGRGSTLIWTVPLPKTSTALPRTWDTKTSRPG